MVKCGVWRWHRNGKEVVKRCEADVDFEGDSKQGKKSFANRQRRLLEDKRGKEKWVEKEWKKIKKNTTTSEMVVYSRAKS